MGHFGNIIDELTIDHREVEEIFGRIEALPPGDERRKQYADEATVELVRHYVAEEMHLYPVVRRFVPVGGDMADTEIGGHLAAEKLMKQLERHTADDPEFDRILMELMRTVRSHVHDVEQRIFPRLRQAAAPEVLNELGDRVRHAKRKAPTHPHPWAPLRPPMSRFTSPGAGLVDRVRDALFGHSRGD